MVSNHSQENKTDMAVVMDDITKELIEKSFVNFIQHGDMRLSANEEELVITDQSIFTGEWGGAFLFLIAQVFVTPSLKVPRLS